MQRKYTHLFPEFKCDYSQPGFPTCNGSNIGGFNRLSYDMCAYNKTLQQSINPCSYQLYFGAQEHCKKCRPDENFWRKYDLVDVESDLWNINRPNSKCPQYKYNNKCKTSEFCISTFSKDAPVIYAPEICPIIYNNIPKITSITYAIPDLSLGPDIKFKHFNVK